MTSINSADQHDDQPLLTMDEAARLLTLSTRTLQYLHREGKGPPRYRLGRRVVYRRDEVLHWALGHGV